MKAHYWLVTGWNYSDRHPSGQLFQTRCYTFEDAIRVGTSLTTSALRLGRPGKDAAVEITKVEG